MLESIIRWKMTDEEARTIHIMILFLNECKKLRQQNYPCIARVNTNIKGDPRKTLLFKHCWQLRRETKGLLTAEEYRLYIQGNFELIVRNNGIIHPGCINGDKAWIRYKIWRRLFKQKAAEIAAALNPPSAKGTDHALIAEIDRTKKFLFEKCDGEVTLEKLNDFIVSGFFRIWLEKGKVSPYYVVLSQYISKLNATENLLEYCMASKTYYEAKITDGMREYFKFEFSYEYQ